MHVVNRCYQPADWDTADEVEAVRADVVVDPAKARVARVLKAEEGTRAPDRAARPPQRLDRAAGGEAVLKEIEELADGTGCSVNPTGCVGACNQAPNAVLVQRGQEYLQTKIDTVEKSAALVEKACGVKPNLDDPALRQRLTAARRMRMRQQAREEKKWNIALKGMAVVPVSGTVLRCTLSTEAAIEHVAAA